LLWSSKYNEIITGHGYGEQSVSIWRYPSLDRIKVLKGHKARVLSLDEVRYDDYNASDSSRHELMAQNENH